MQFTLSTVYVYNIKYYNVIISAVIVAIKCYVINCYSLLCGRGRKELTLCDVLCSLREVPYIHSDIILLYWMHCVCVTLMLYKQTCTHLLRNIWHNQLEIIVTLMLPIQIVNIFLLLAISVDVSTYIHNSYAILVKTICNHNTYQTL